MPDLGISMGRVREFLTAENCPDDWEMFPCWTPEEKCLGIVILSPDRTRHGWIDATDSNKDIHLYIRPN
jgi:hypothetical protein